MKLGYIKLARQLLEHPIWTTERFTRGQAWVDLLLIAQFTPYSFRIRGNLIELNRGQIGHSKAHLAGRWKWDRKTVQAFLNELESDGMITQQKTRVVTVVTIVNYGTWQDSQDDQVADAGQQNPHQNGQQNGQQNPQQTGQQNGHIIRKNKKDKKVKKVEEETIVFPDGLDTEGFRTGWLEWEAYKLEQHKFTFKPTGRKAAFTQAIKRGPAVTLELIQQSMANGWKGLIEKDTQNGRQTGANADRKMGINPASRIRNTDWSKVDFSNPPAVPKEPPPADEP